MDDLSLMGLMDLMKHCHDETQNYKEGLPSDSQYGLEIFKRAVKPGVTEQDAAWQALIEIYRPSLPAMLHRSDLFSALNLSADEVTHILKQENAIVQDAFVRLFRRTKSETAEPLVFKELGQAITFFYRCLLASVATTVRERRRDQQWMVSLPDNDDTSPFALPAGGASSSLPSRLRNPEEQLLDSEAYRALEAKVLQCVNTLREVHVIYQHWFLKEKPKGIVAAWPTEIPKAFIQLWVQTRPPQEQMLPELAKDEQISLDEVNRILVLVKARLIRRYPELKPKRPPTPKKPPDAEPTP